MLYTIFIHILILFHELIKLPKQQRKQNSVHYLCSFQDDTSCNLHAVYICLFAVNTCCQKCDRQSRRLALRMTGNFLHKCSHTW